MKKARKELHEMVLTETITKNDLPDTFEADYYHKHMDNTMKCTFTEVNEASTLYEYEIEYTRINWFMPRLMAILFPSVYRKPVKKWMDNFKVFVEQQP
ncbi:SRPBCC family protein [Fulvivirga sp. RKSG066]|uniref:SRPBCC family protein n=1 Tax=Fulvivirga aurantia TaxID=2529383 RepID=UPI0012BC3DB6|nr:SRPBCC family protein [Fulvivirga aurantia]MTI21689.1 SRPBCC family protein [Fulvivirga aurantia]